MAPKTSSLSSSCQNSPVTLQKSSSPEVAAQTHGARLRAAGFILLFTMGSVCAVAAEADSTEERTTVPKTSTGKLQKFKLRELAKGA